MKTFIKRFFCGGLCLAFLVILGCSANQPYHTDKGNESVGPINNIPDIPGEVKKSVFVVQCKTDLGETLKRSFNLGFVEFDNQGDFFNFSQLTNLLQSLKKTLDSSSSKMVLVTYVHGWQNNAQVEGLGVHERNSDVQAALDTFNDDVKNEKGDVQRFKHFLAILANTPALSDKKVYGIYLGWRGELIQNPSNDPVTKYVIMTVPRALTVWSRQSTASRMGDGSSFGLTLEAIHTFTENNKAKVFSVFMGHSFGAKILEQAIVQWALRRFGGDIANDPDPERKRFTTRYADLVLFLNPATEGIYARRLTHILETDGKNYWQKDPLFVAVTSNTDVATGLAFPVAGTLGTVAGAYRRFNDGTPQGSYFRKTSGHSDYLINGDITVSDNRGWNEGQRKGKGKVDFVKKSEISTVDETKNLDHKIEVLNTNLVRPPTQDPQADYKVFLSNGLIGEIVFQKDMPSDKPANRTPYWVLNVDKQMIDGHSGIWSNDAMNLYARLFILSSRNRSASLTK